MASGPRHFPFFGWMGILILLLCEVLVWLGSAIVATWFTPLMWTGYILLADALVARLGGASWLTTRQREIPLLLLLSVGVWLMFEAYNLHLRNWVYVNVPETASVRNLAYFWSFATIMPGVFETSDLLSMLLPSGRRKASEAPLRPGALAAAFAVGLALVTIPLAVPEHVAAYLFAAVWIGFIPLLEPVLDLLGVGGVLRDWRNGKWQTAAALLLGGLVCGFLWETWNYQAYLHAGAFWVYTIPQPLRVLGLHFGKMPVLGLLGFPPFALELHALYQILKALLGGDSLFGRSPHADSLTASREKLL